MANTRLMRMVMRGAGTMVVATGLLLSPMQAQGQIAAAGRRSADGIWETISDRSMAIEVRRTDLLGPYAVLRLNKAALDQRLARAPREGNPVRPGQDVVIMLPLPDGRFSPFRIEESPILAPEVAAAFPTIKTYRGAGVEDRTATARLDWTSEGFHGLVIAAGATIYIDPYTKGELATYVSYDKATVRKAPADGDRPRL